MARIRISTTVDESTLLAARAAHGPGTDATLIDAALQAFLGLHRRAEIGAAYAAAYSAQPIETDEWGDLAEWHGAVTVATRYTEAEDR